MLNKFLLKKLTISVKVCTSGRNANVGASFFNDLASRVLGGSTSEVNTRPHVYRLASTITAPSAQAPYISPWWISRRLIDDDPLSLSRRLHSIYLYVFKRICQVLLFCSSCQLIEFFWNKCSVKHILIKTAMELMIMFFIGYKKYIRR